MTEALPLTVQQAFLATVFSAVIIFLTRLFPFALFKGRKVPGIINFIERYLPAMIMAVLAVYCFKDVNFTQAPFGASYIFSGIAVVVLHLVFKNSMVSIFGSTILFMILSRFI